MALTFGEGLAAIGSGLEKRQTRIDKDREDNQRAQAFSKFFKSAPEFSKSLGIDPGQLDDMSTTDFDILHKMLPAMQAQKNAIASRAINQQKANTETLKAQTAGLNATTAFNKARSELSKQDFKEDQIEGIQGFFGNFEKAIVSAQNGEQVPQGMDELMRNNDMRAALQLHKGGVTITPEMMSDIMNKSQGAMSIIDIPSADGKTVAKHWVNKQTQSINPDPISVSPPRTVGVASESQRRTANREDKASSFIADIDSDSRHSVREMSELNTLKDMLSNEGFQTGAGAEAKLFAGNLLKTFGVDIGLGDDLTQQGLFNHIKQNFMSKRFEETKGAISDKEVTLFDKSITSFANTTEGNLKLIEFMLAAEQKKINVSKEIERLQSDELGLTEREVKKQLKAFIEAPENDLTGLLLKKKKDNSQASQQASGSIPTFTTIEEAASAGLKPGDRFMFNGVEQKVD